MNKEVQMNFKKIRGRIVITAGVLAMTVVPQAVSAACVQTQNAGEIRQPAYLSDEGSVCSDFGKNRSCGGSSFCLTSDGWMNNGDSERCGFRYLFWGCNSDGENGDGGICFKPDCGETDTPGCGNGDEGENRPDGTPGDDEGNTPGRDDSEVIQPGGKPGSGDGNISGGGTSGNQSSSYGSEVTDLVNQQRSAQGLSPLSYDSELTKLAQLKAEDMAENNYFSHQSPTYGSAFDMMQSAGVSYRSAGENIARGQKTPAAVMDSWMNSQGHRENILSLSYTSIGVGYAVDDSGRACWVQIFKG